MKVRIQFAKYGVMKFIGHLDVMRFFQKAIRRADIDIRYSEGFSPHQIMSFAAPLGVGIESTGEYLDIEVNSMTSTDEIKDALNRVMVEGMEVLSVKQLPDTVKNAMASVAAAGYMVIFTATDSKENDEDISVNNPITDFLIRDLGQKLSDFHIQEHIMVTKTTKKSVMEIDIKPGIFELKAGNGINLPKQDKNNNPAVYMLLDASSSGNIKPSMVMEELCKFCQVEFVKYNWQIIRIETYTRDDSGVLIPLSAVGK